MNPVAGDLVVLTKRADFLPSPGTLCEVTCNGVGNLIFVRALGDTVDCVVEPRDIRPATPLEALAACAK